MKPKFRSLKSMTGSTMTSVVVVSMAMAASSSASLWTGAVDNNWDNLGNWDSNPSGGVGEVDTLTNFPVITADNTLWPNDLKIAASPGKSGRVDIRSGTFKANYWTFVGDWDGNATLNIADTTSGGGTFTGFATGSGSFDSTANLNGNLMVGLYNSTGVVNVNTSGSLHVTELRLSPNGQGGSATFNLDAGTVNVDGSFQAGSDFWGANTASPANINMSGGAINVGYEFWHGGSGTGTTTMTGGTISNGSWFVVGRNSGSVGTFNMSGGTVNSATTNGSAFATLASFGGSQGTMNLSGTANFNSTNIYVGEGGTGTMTVADSATVTVSGGIQVGRNNGSSGTYTQTGGAVNLNGGGFTLGRYTATGTASISGGTLNAAGDSAIGHAGTGTLTISGTGTFSQSASTSLLLGASGGTGTINLDGGTLQAHRVATTGSGTFNFNGGTFQINSATDTLFNASTTANIMAGGAMIDTNGFDKTVGAALLDGDGLDGGLTKQGAGTLTLDGVNTYTGATVVSAGTLLVTGALGNSAVTVESGATIGGSGTIAGTLTMNDGAILDTTGGTLSVTGLVTLGTALDHFGFADLVGFDVYTAGAGTYTLMDGSSFNFDYVDNFGLENALDLGGGKSAYFQSGSLQVVVIPEPGAALLGSLGMLALLRRRRSR